MNCWIKSNTGDYVEENNGNYFLHIIKREYEVNGEVVIVEPQYLKISEVEFRNLKGFIPIKAKKLYTRINSAYRGKHEYKSSGKGLEQTKVLTIAEMREAILKNILNGR